MANEQNLKPIRTTERARELQEKAAQKQRENIARRKTLKETLLMMLEEGNTQNDITLALLQKALNGDTKAYEVIRDTVGEKPTDKIEQSGDSKLDVNIRVIESTTLLRRFLWKNG